MTEDFINDPDLELLDKRLAAHLARPVAPEPEVRARVEAVRRRIDVEVPVVAARPSAVLGYRYLGVSLAVAAALVVGFFAINYIPNLINTTQTTPALTTKTYATTNAQRATIILDDGSQAVLAPATTIHVTGRNVELKGEAVFTVTQSSANPFTVRSGTTVTRVLGTTFGIRAYPNDSLVRVAVSDGKVSVGNVVGQGASPAARPQDAILSAGSIATLTPTTTLIKHDADISPLIAWTGGAIIFQLTPLSSVIRDLERWYDLEIQLQDKTLATKLVTITFDNEPGTRATARLADVLGVRYTHTGRLITFHSLEN